MFEEKNDSSHTDLSELGEFGLIKRLTSDITSKNSSTIKGVGDDAAVLDFKDKQVLVSTDLLVEGVHFDLTYYPLKHLGYKAAVVNFSDIYAMNGHPKQMFVGLAVSSRFPAEALDELYEGMKLACERYGVDLAGGDTTSSHSGLMLSISVTGEVEAGKAVYRNGANENDLICVSGDLGGAYIGLLLLEREKHVFKANPDMQPDLSGADYILERQLKPEAGKITIEKLAAAGIMPTSMIDISDGLASEILHICTDSEKGCAIYAEKIPIDFVTSDFAESFNISPLTAALNGGEDYELLFTIPIDMHEKIKELEHVSVIGHITNKESGCLLVTTDGSAVELTAQGWNHMRKES
ncbi:MAG: thiamine-phosphate kinase [Bacteroidales bacterium]|jgi:thiamine-monophosphate kinase|nr:thiamine-phosphate kinase [Bacteroidales bacterium]